MISSPNWFNNTFSVDIEIPYWGVRNGPGLNYLSGAYISFLLIRTHNDLLEILLEIVELFYYSFDDVTPYATAILISILISQTTLNHGIELIEAGVFPDRLRLANRFLYSSLCHFRR